MFYFLFLSLCIVHIILIFLYIYFDSLKKTMIIQYQRKLIWNHQKSQLPTTIPSQKFIIIIKEKLIYKAIMSNSNLKLIKKDPNKALRKLVIPILILNFIITMYTITDGIWISGINSAAIVAVATIIPLNSILIGISGGLGIGTTSAVGYYIGADDRKSAILSCKNALFLFLIFSIILTALFLIILKPLLISYPIGNKAINEGLNYGIPLFLGSFTYVFSSGLFGIFRGSGETKKPLYALGTSFLINIIFDPVFIYVFNWGVAGAATISVLSSLLSVIMLSYWLFHKKTIYPDFNDYKFKFDTNIIKRILNVGIPATFEVLIISIAATILIYFTNIAGGNHGVAVHSLGYRIYQFSLIPISSICAALVIVVSNAYGDKNIDNIKKVFKYSCKLTISFGLLSILIVALFSDQLSLIFAFSKDSASLLPDISLFIRIIFLSLPFMGLGLSSTFVFQGLSKGTYSLVWTLIREFILSLFFVYFFGFIMNWGLIGIWIGFVIGKSSSTIFTYLHTNHYINKLKISKDN